MTIDYQVFYADIPSEEAITPNEDGTYTIFINPKLTMERQRQVFLHALKHITQDDFNQASADQVELLRHDIADRDDFER